MGEAPRSGGEVSEKQTIKGKLIFLSFCVELSVPPSGRHPCGVPCAEGDRSGVLDPKNEGWGSHDSGGRRERNNKTIYAFKLRSLLSSVPQPPLHKARRKGASRRKAIE